MRKTTSGFTIVELLIVIVVIAVLAAISVVAYTGIQNRTYNSTVQSDLSNLSKKLELLRIDASDGLYPSALTVGMAISLTKSAYFTGGWNVYYCPSADRASYAVGVISKSGDRFYLQNGATTQTQAALTSTTTCGLVGQTAASVTNGYSGATQTWFSWVN